MQRAPRAAWWAYAAATWALAFAAYSFYGALGGELGVDQLASDIREQAEDRDPGFVAQLWVAGALKLAIAILALALVRPWGRALPDRLPRIAACVVAIGLLLYGGVNEVQFGLMKLDLIDTPDSVGAYAVDWYVFLWEPTWLLGGCLFAAAAWSFGRANPR
jgi:hypothetical protein